MNRQLFVFITIGLVVLSAVNAIPHFRGLSKKAPGWGKRSMFDELALENFCETKYQKALRLKEHLEQELELLNSMLDSCGPNSNNFPINEDAIQNGDSNSDDKK